MSTDYVELDDAAWIKERDTICRTFLGISAEDFVAKFMAGGYEDEDDGILMTVLAYFPELD